MSLKDLLIIYLIKTVFHNKELFNFNNKSKKEKKLKLVLLHPPIVTANDMEIFKKKEVKSLFC